MNSVVYCIYCVSKWGGVGWGERIILDIYPDNEEVMMVSTYLDLKKKGSACGGVK